MSEERIPRFELHIRPLMRLIDREKMIAAADFDLWRYEDVKEWAEDIVPRIKNDMPPFRYGGPWPAEWIALFERWVDSGCLRLELGTVDAPGYRAVRDGENIVIRARGTLPDEGYRHWLDPVVSRPDRREYVFYWEPPVSTTGATMAFRLREKFRATVSLVTVLIRDASGVHEIEIEGNGGFA